MEPKETYEKNTYDLYDLSDPIDYPGQHSLINFSTRLDRLEYYLYSRFG